MWRVTMPIRYTGDVQNGWSLGSAASEKGWVAFFNDQYAGGKGKADPGYWLDYPPLRLLIMTKWAGWTKSTFGARGWQQSYEFHAPVLASNTIAAFLGSVAAFLVVWLWARRSVADPSPWAGFLKGAIAATLLWFNPAVLWIGHGFPQWDLWVVPFFLFAILAVCVDRFLIAGLLIATGAMMKGQMLCAAPVFLLWCIFAGRFEAALRFAIGFLAGAAVVASPWLLQSIDAKIWVRNVLAATAFAAPALLLRRAKWVRIIAIAIAITVILIPVLRPPQLAAREFIKFLILTILLIVPLLIGVRHQRLPHLFAGAFAAAAFACVPLFAGSLAWFDISFRRAGVRYNTMGTLSASNLSTILERRFGWSFEGENAAVRLAPYLGISWFDPLPLPKLLYALFAIGLVLCGIAAAIQSRRHSARLVLALMLPFVLMFMLLPHMHNRYLIYASATSCVLVAVGVGPALLGVLISLACWSMMAVNQFESNREYSGQWYTALAGLHVDIGWALLLMAATLLYLALYPGRRCPMLF